MCLLWFSLCHRHCQEGEVEDGWPGAGRTAGGCGAAGRSPGAPGPAARWPRPAVPGSLLVPPEPEPGGRAELGPAAPEEEEEAAGGCPRTPQGSVPLSSLQPRRRESQDTNPQDLGSLSHKIHHRVPQSQSHWLSQGTHKPTAAAAGADGTAEHRVVRTGVRTRHPKCHGRFTDLKGRDGSRADAGCGAPALLTKPLVLRSV